MKTKITTSTKTIIIYSNRCSSQGMMRKLIWMSLYKFHPIVILKWLLKKLDIKSTMRLKQSKIRWVSSKRWLRTSKISKWARLKRKDLSQYNMKAKEFKKFSRKCWLFRAISVKEMLLFIINQLKWRGLMLEPMLLKPPTKKWGLQKMWNQTSNQKFWKIIKSKRRCLLTKITF